MTNEPVKHDDEFLDKAVNSLLPKALKGFSVQSKALTYGANKRTPLMAQRILLLREITAIGVRQALLEERVVAIEAAKSIHSSAFASAADDLEDLLQKFMGGHTGTKAPDRKSSASPILKSVNGG